ncbi:DUF72 domain-containing protein [Neolewinella aurantiaca]|uniref:DUF72 domain-containing protein n=1 Tax=Neolewinella aurantiaca TaxID=2602767 RepID=A0A5C7FS98_9BACT|nr:DUF72 domain-containing protein [Neolewinella aurantiaca]TXF87575.1 DUF72 domain-containing protein [Neolewinella aurantiaca]
MKFGKADDLSNVNFDLPKDPVANTDRLLQHSLSQSNTKPHIYIGATGWSMKEWVGKWYPDKTKSADYLREYGKQFNTIELNTTHYRVPAPDLVARWCSSVPDDFRFCPKVPQTISHSNDFGMPDGTLEVFIRSMDGMRDKLGCVFLQLPPYFGANRLKLLTIFLDRWPQTLPLAVEVRHASWFSAPAATEALMSALAARNIAAVITDVAGRRDVLHNYVTAPRTMIRFVGNGLRETDFTRLAAWSDKLKEWNLPETYFFPHEPDNILSPDASAWFARHIEADGFATTRGPKIWEGPPQMSLF